MTGFYRCFRTILISREMVVSLPISLGSIIKTNIIEMSSDPPPDALPKKGKFVVDNDGVFKIKADGGLAVFNSEGECPECCECEPYTLATWTASDYATWNLSQYQGDGVAKKKRYWRLTNNYTGYVPIRRGCVDEHGKLVGLPGSISTTTYKYTWTFRIEIGCRDGNVIRFPTGTESSSLYNC